MNITQGFYQLLGFNFFHIKNACNKSKGAQLLYCICNNFCLSFHSYLT